MGKRIDDLPLDDTPLGPTPDARGTEWYRFVTDIEDLLSTGDYTWAESTLRAIQLTVEQTKRVTDGQQRAVDNIEHGRYKRRWDR